MNAIPKKLGIVAGGGILPGKLRAFCAANGINSFTIGFEGHADAAASDRLMRLGEAGNIISVLREKGCNDLVLIGSVKRPKLTELRPDLRTAAFYAKLGLRALGDDGFLKAIRAELEDEGFTLHGIHEFMPELLIGHGVVGGVIPSDEQMADIRAGLAASRKIGEEDVGQSVVVLNGKILGEEDDNGTNALIKRAAEKGAVLVKSSKPQQDRKLDMPTLGSDTVKLCASLGYAGIAAEAGGVLIADRDDMVSLANQSGLFVVGI